MAASTQHKLSSVRAPRVHISYEVETGGAGLRKELPFKVGVLAPLGGNASEMSGSLRDKKMISVDRDNLDLFMESVAPRLSFSVDNTLDPDGGDLQVDLSFSSIDGFSPLSVVKQVPELNDLHSSRSKLRDLLSKMDGNDTLSDLLNEIFSDQDRLSALTQVFEEAESDIDAAQASGDSTKAVEAIPEASRAAGTDLGQILNSSGLILESSQASYALELLQELFLSTNKDGSHTLSSGSNLAGLLSTLIAKRDGLVSRQLNRILHNHEFQSLEASWRGLAHLVMNSQTGSNLKISVLSTTFDELYRDLDKAVEFDQSALFRIIYEEEFGTYGGEPYSLLVGDFSFGRSNKEISFLEKISQVAAAAHVPFVASAYAKLFDLGDFDALHKPRDLSKIFESAELIKWRNFRESEDSRYVTLTLPKVMMRLPYSSSKNPAAGIVFDEQVGRTVYQLDDDGVVKKDANGNPQPIVEADGTGFSKEMTRKQTDSAKILWGNPAYLLATNITSAFTRYGWTAAIRGVDGGGLVTGLPAYSYETEDGEVTLACPTQVAITDRREKELNDLGFMSLCHCKGTDKAAFFGGQTTNKPKKYLTSAASKNAEVSAMLPYMLAASRFAHYIKVMMRERIGSFSTGQNIQDYLNNWISQYVLLDDTAPQAVKARYPLREARVDVIEDEENVGSFKATVFLRPHFQLEELSTSIRLVADLPA